MKLLLSALTLLISISVSAQQQIETDQIEDGAVTKAKLADTFSEVVGTPVDNQIGVWTGADSIEGDSEFVYDGNLGIGVASTFSKLHVLESGTGFTPTFADVLVQDSNLTSSLAMISLISGTAATAQLTFGDVDDQFGGQVFYNNVTNTFSINVGLSTIIKLDSAGVVTFTPLSTAPAGVLGSEYTDTSGAKCWHDGAAWVKIAGSGTCV